MMSSHKLDEHIASDEKTHAELKGKFEVLFKVIRKWALVGGIMGGILGHAIHALEGCAAMPLPSPAAVTAYQNEQVECVAQNNTRNDIDACRAASRNHWCSMYPSSANCPWNRDGGNE
jgi:hypothetical protein